MNFTLRHSLFLPLLCVSLLAGCDIVTNMSNMVTQIREINTKMKEAAVHSVPIEAEIERAAGMRPSVFISDTGSVLVVSVQFSDMSSKSVQSLETICRAAVVREFKKEPTMLTLSFSVQASPG